ncbi:MAG: hypothetical protein ACFFAS_07700 [Promethearchaeota archaeon]
MGSEFRGRSDQQDPQEWRRPGEPRGRKPAILRDPAAKHEQGGVNREADRMTRTRERAPTRNPR